VHSQHLIKNRILRQLSADELKSVQPWLTLVQLKSNVVLHEPGGAVRWSVPPFTTEVECKMASLGADLDRLLKSDRAANRYDAPCAGWVSAAGLAPTSGKIVTQIQIGCGFGSCHAFRLQRVTWRICSVVMVSLEAEREHNISAASKG